MGKIEAVPGTPLECGPFEENYITLWELVDSALCLSCPWLYRIKNQDGSGVFFVAMNGNSIEKKSKQKIGNKRIYQPLEKLLENLSAIISSRCRQRIYSPLLW